MYTTDPRELGQEICRFVGSCEETDFPKTFCFGGCLLVMHVCIKWPLQIYSHGNLDESHLKEICDEKLDVVTIYLPANGAESIACAIPLYEITYSII